MFDSYSVVLDDWLAIYTFVGGELDGHQSVRVTELWPEWSPVGERDTTEVENRLAESRVLARADQEGPPDHGHISPGHSDGQWCGKCAATVDDTWGIGVYDSLPSIPRGKR